MAAPRLGKVHSIRVVIFLLGLIIVVLLITNFRTRIIGEEPMKRMPREKHIDTSAIIPRAVHEHSSKKNDKSSHMAKDDKISSAHKKSLNDVNSREISKSRNYLMVHQHNLTMWTNVSHVCGIPHDTFPVAELRTSAGGLLLSTYNSSQAFFAKVMFESKVYQGDLLEKVIKILKTEKDAHFMDIGALNGEYGFTAAMLGHNVTMIDPVIGNIQRICETTKEASLSLFDKIFDKIEVIFNAVGDGVEKVSLKFKSDNVGETRVKRKIENGEESIVMVTLDEVIPFVKSKKVVMKMNVQTFEDEVVVGAEKFFATYDVRYCVMEWVHHRNYPNGAKIIYDFMTKHRMVPLAGHRKTLEQLDFKDHKKWDSNVIWKKVDRS